MKLANILEGLDILEWRGSQSIAITYLGYHSNKAVPDSAFVAIEGMKSDGHQYISDAISKGAVAIIVSREIKQIDIPAHVIEKLTIVRVRDTRFALSRMAANFYGHPSKSLNMIGVTGTNGKTTITWLIHAILEQKESSTGQIGSLGIFSNHEWRPSSYTTPESLELQKHLREIKDAGASYCVMEVSSHALALGRVNDVLYDAAVFTNLTHEHLDFHHSMEQYYQAKKKLFQKTNCLCIINTDDPYGRRLATELVEVDPARQVVTYGLDGDNLDFMAHTICMKGIHTDFQLSTPDGILQLRTALPGLYNVYNCVAAAACAHSLGMKLTEIKIGLEQVKNIPGRFEVIPADRNINIIIDYAHTPDGFQKLLQTVKETARGRIVMVFGCVGERDQSKRRIMGEIASQYCDLCVLTTDNCRSENPKNIIEQIKKGFPLGTNFAQILDREEAIRYAVLHSKENDTILITGKGHEQKQIIGNKIFPFNEREIVYKALTDRLQRISVIGTVGQVSV